MIFILYILFVVLVRIEELVLSKRNEKWLLQNGAIEYGARHYKFIVLLHLLFFCSLIFEYIIQKPPSFSVVLLVFYLLLLVFKIWVILSLGKFWNTKIYHIPNVPLIKKGPYKYFTHPNYAVVIVEIAVIPLAFYLYYTAIIFTVLNAIALFVRMKEENKVLKN